MELDIGWNTMRLFGEKYYGNGKVFFGATFLGPLKVSALV